MRVFANRIPFGLWNALVRVGSAESLGNGGLKLNASTSVVLTLRNCCFSKTGRKRRG